MLFICSGSLCAVILWLVEDIVFLNDAGVQVLRYRQAIENDPDVMPGILRICVIEVFYVWLQ